MQSLAQTALSPSQQALLRSTSKLGQRETLREELARSLRHERMGLPLPQGSRLFRDRGGRAAAVDDDDDDMLHDDSDDDVRCDDTRTEQLCPDAVEQPLPPAVDDEAPSAPADPLAELAARAMGTKRQKKDRQALKRHKVALELADEEGPVSKTEAVAALRPTARALRADITGEAEGVGDDTMVDARAAARRMRAPGMPDPAQWTRSAEVVHVTRPPQVEAQRLKLPIVGMEQEIMEAVHEHAIVLLCGETGCGKTTQVPQFLYEAGYARHGAGICVTQPRRVAVTSTAARVAAELDVPLGGPVVGYAVRHDVRGRGEGDAPPALRFVTDGVLLREAQADALLSKYSVIVLDEAHERSVNTDILLGLLSRIVPLRQRMAAESSSASGDGTKPLKLVVMSATLAVDDMAQNKALFPSGPPPVVRVPARQFPVTLHFARRTPPEGEHLRAALRKACALHRRLPPGGVLIFVTGAREVEALCAQLRRAFNSSVSAGTKSELCREEDALEDAFDRDALDDDGDAPLDLSFDHDSDVDADGDGASDSDESETHMLGGDASAEDIEEAEVGDDGHGGPGPVHVVPLYAMLSPAAQARAFQPPPDGHRLMVVATNVAETSLTLPGVRYVIDAGLAKQRVPVDAIDGASGGSGSALRLGWISQASSTQRAGRAGRTGPGHCYRLYSSAHYVNSMPPHEAPDVLAAPLDGVVLHMKAMGIDYVERFPFPTPPPATALHGACVALTRLGALADTPQRSGELTHLGARMAQLPVPPRCARFLLAAASSEALTHMRGSLPPQHVVLPLAVAVAATLSLDSPFVQHNDAGSAAPAGMTPPATGGPVLATSAAAVKQRQAALHHPRSDALSAAVALLTFEAAEEASRGGGEALCVSHGLHSRTLREASQLRRQLARLLARRYDVLVASTKGGSRTASSTNQQLVIAALTASHAPQVMQLYEDASGVEAALRVALACGHPDRIARRVKPADQVGAAPPGRAVRYKAACEVVTLDNAAGAHLLPLPGPGAKKEGGAADAAAASAPSSTVYVHPTSSLRRGAPEWVCYTHIMATGSRPYLVGATQMDPVWLAPACPALVRLSQKPLPVPTPAYDHAADAVMAWHSATYGPPAWELPPVGVALPPNDETASAAFAVALLSGHIAPPLGRLIDRLAVPPTTAGQAQHRGMRRVGELLHALRTARVASKAALAAAWLSDPAFLRAQLTDWMREGQAHVLHREWPHIVGSITAATQEPRVTGKTRRTD